MARYRDGLIAFGSSLIVPPATKCDRCGVDVEGIADRPKIQHSHGPVPDYLLEPIKELRVAGRSILIISK
jgi:hypothetical protein